MYIYNIYTATDDAGRQQRYIPAGYTFLIPFLDGDRIPRMRQKQNRESGINTYLACQFWKASWINKEHNPQCPTPPHFYRDTGPLQRNVTLNVFEKFTDFQISSSKRVARWQGTKRFMRRKSPVENVDVSFRAQNHCTQHPVGEKAPCLLFGLLIILSRSSSPNEHLAVACSALCMWIQRKHLFDVLIAIQPSRHQDRIMHCWNDWTHLAIKSVLPRPTSHAAQPASLADASLWKSLGKSSILHHLFNQHKQLKGLLSYLAQVDRLTWNFRKHRKAQFICFGTRIMAPNGLCSFSGRSCFQGPVVPKGARLRTCEAQAQSAISEKYKKQRALKIASIIDW